MQSLIDQLKDHIVTPRNDGVFHFSQHLQHDRHTTLYYKFGYPTPPTPAWGSVFPLLQGTGVHETLHSMIAPMVENYLAEYPLKRVVDGYTWSGTVDAYVSYNDERWILDYKTISGTGMEFLHDEPKPEHILQASAYKWLTPTDGWRTAIVYLPSSPDYRKRWAEPVVMEFEALSEDIIVERIKAVHAGIYVYEQTGVLPAEPAPEWRWKKKGKKYELWIMPHYSSLFCPWKHEVDDPCGCSQQKAEKIAEYADGELSCEDEYRKSIEEMGVPE